jgi:hypothetical protein
MMRAPTRHRNGGSGRLDHQHDWTTLMTHPTSITFAVAAGPVDWALTLVVAGTVLVALIANALALTAWLRRRP